MQLLNRLNTTHIKVGIRTLLFFVFIFSVIAVPASVLAQQPDLGLQFAAETGLGTTDIRVTVARIIRAFLGLLGIVGVGIVLYGGFIWMTSGGDASKIDRAKKILINGAIGLAIVLSSFGITQFVINALSEATLGTGQIGSSGGGAQQIGGGGLGGGALGRSLRTHYPERDAVDVARNTKIIITFNEPIDDATIIDPQGGLVRTDAIKIYKSIDSSNGSFPADNLLVPNVQVQTADNQTFVLRPQAFLGSPSENVAYTVYLTDNIRKSNGDSVFSGIAPSYAWEFTTGTTIDVTPPRIDSASPLNPTGCPADRAKCNPRNKVIQINFNEAIDPTTITGKVPGFNLIDIQYENTASNGKQPLPGEFVVSNQYRTVTFMSSTGCEGVKENSCGEPVYCLPANAQIDLTLKAAAIDQQLGAPQASFPYNGLVDVAGNSFDGQGGPTGTPDGVAAGPPTDNYAWTFHTSNDVDLTPPSIKSVAPNINESNVNLNKDIEITFSKNILGTSLYDGVNLEYNSSKDATRRAWDGGYVVEFGKTQKTITDPVTKQPVTVEVVDPTIVTWRHFDPLIGSTQQNGTFVYFTKVTSALKDDLQNCFFPGEGPTTASPAQRCERLDPLTIYPNSWKNNNNNSAQYPDCILN